MRISKVRLAGFKTFVDPTTLHLPANLTGIVGPNGCGKSNIIDAVQWVMGESSAKHLRGESMADVVFNGSASRKPVQQASVELVFDNADGRLGGEYASYAEIAIRRVVNREGISTYTLNGTRCRRADITQLFLGTGAGARSYAVIEQGMISRIVEARPDDLRAFIEEAAGISKYKARRHETEIRMANTRDNLQRVADLREELRRQAARLAEQARAAALHNTLAQELARTELALLALRYRNLESALLASESERQARTTAHDLAQQRRFSVQQARDGARDARGAAQLALAEAQQGSHAASGEVTRIEQALKLTRERRNSLQTSLQQTEQEQAASAERLAHDSAALAGLEADIARLEPEFEQASTRAQAALEALQAAEAAGAEANRLWEAHLRRAAEQARQERVEQTRLQHLAGQLHEVAERMGALTRQRQTLAAQLAAAEAESPEGSLKAVQEALRNAQMQAESRAQGLAAARKSVAEAAQRLAECRGELQHARGRLASLDATQNTALGKNANEVRCWLESRGESRGLRLAELLAVASGWEQAVEAALGSRLELIWLEQGAAQLTAIDLPQGVIGVIAADAVVPAHQHLAQSLAAQVGGSAQVQDWLAGLGAADSEVAARELLAVTPDFSAVALADGTLIGRNWCWRPLAGSTDTGLLVRERDLRQLRAAIAELAAMEQERVAVLADRRAEVERLEQEERQAQVELKRLREDEARLRSELAALKARAEQLTQRLEADRVALEHLAVREQSLGEEHAALAERVQALQSEQPEVEAERLTLQARRDALSAEVQSGRLNWREARDAAHALEIRQTGLAQQVQGARLAIERGAQALARLASRVEELKSELSTAAAPLAGLEAELEAALQLRLEREQAVTRARAALGDREHELVAAESSCTAAEREEYQAREALEAARMDAQSVTVRRDDLMAEAARRGQDLTTPDPLPEGRDEVALAAEVERIGRRMARLGAINLAAIEEHATASERLGFLDAQHADLTAALETLETAIRTIDRETRSRFEETLKRVDTGFQQLFPRLFGGGSASLRLLGDNLLDAGIGVTAQPPGKRNGTIHLLSGGEKALTAIALIFAIFELNPAPFCLLDEVDAPLDDPNVLRLCELLKQMSKSVQFIFVSHNKGTMEIAEQLIGVTMQEPGVSRLVPVNVEQAVAMAASN